MAKPFAGLPEHNNTMRHWRFALRKAGWVLGKRLISRIKGISINGKQNDTRLLLQCRMWQIT